MPSPSDTAAGPVLVPPFVVHTRKGGHGGHSLASAWRQAMDHRADPRFSITDAARRRFSADEFLAACAVLTAPPSPPRPSGTASVVVTTNQPGVTTPATLTVWPPAASVAASAPPPAPALAAAVPASDEEEIDLAVELPPMALPLRMPPPPPAAGVAAESPLAAADAAEEAAAGERPRPLTARLRRTSARVAAEAEPTEVVDRSRQMTVIGLVAVALGIALAGWWLASGSRSPRATAARVDTAAASTEPVFATEPEPARAAAPPAKPTAGKAAAPAKPAAPNPAPGRLLPPTTPADDGGPPAVADLAAALVAHWTFDDDDPTRSVDASGRGNDLRLSGVKRVPGRSGSALRFDGAGGATCDALSGLGGAETTVMAWVRIPGAQKHGLVSLLRHDGRFNVQLTAQLRLVGWRPGDASYQLVEVPWKPHYTDGSWRHLAVTCRRGEVRIFRDGVLHVRRAMPGSGLQAPRAPFMIGATEAGQERFIGAVDEVRLYRAALADAQIAAIVAATPAPVVPVAPPAVPAPAAPSPVTAPPAPTPAAERAPPAPAAAPQPSQDEQAADTPASPSAAPAPAAVDP